MLDIIHDLETDLEELQGVVDKMPKIPRYLVVMDPIKDDEAHCHVCESFETLEDAERYSKGIFQILKIPAPIQWGEDR